MNHYYWTYEFNLKENKKIIRATPITGHIAMDEIIHSHGLKNGEDSRIFFVRH